MKTSLGGIPIAHFDIHFDAGELVGVATDFTVILDLRQVRPLCHRALRNRTSAATEGPIRVEHCAASQPTAPIAPNATTSTQEAPPGALEGTVGTLASRPAKPSPG